MKKLSALFMLALIIMPALMMALPVDAASVNLNKNELFGGNKTNGASGINQAMGNLTEEDPRVVIARVINVLLGFLGIIAVIIVLTGGFKWMMSQGDEGKIDDAKKMITAGIIGLAIILASFAIAQFAVDALFDVMG